LVRGLIPADSAAYNAYNFRTREMQIIHDYGPDGDRYLPVLNDYFEDHPLLIHLRDHWRDGSVSLSDVISRRELRDAPIHTEFFKPLGVREQMAIMIEDRQYAVNGGGLQRSGRNFSRRDKDVLSLLQPHILQAYKNAADMTAAKAESSRFQEAISACQIGVIWLGDNLKIDWLSSKAQQFLEDYCKTQGDGQKTAPESIVDWIKIQRARWQDNENVSPQIPLTVEGRHGRLIVRWIRQSADRSYLILSEERQFPPALMIPGVTVRETEVLRWLAEGKSNQSIAIILGISLRTVEKHMENILIKLKVENRVEAALRAREQFSQLCSGKPPRKQEMGNAKPIPENDGPMPGRRD
jgi:DNA-binding CsgD family transcriptional regulator